jgi:alanine dehydrogenase
MKIGVPKEIKPQENRVGATPGTVAQLIAAGHEVFVESNAGAGIGVSNVCQFGIVCGLNRIVPPGVKLEATII